MGISYDIDAATGILLTTAGGDLTVDDLMGHLREVLGDDRVVAPVRELWDGRGITSFNISPDDLYHGAQAIEASPEIMGGGRLAVVAPSDLVYGMSRMLSAMVDGKTSVEVFRDVAAARVWIGLSETPVEGSAN